MSATAPPLNFDLTAPDGMREQIAVEGKPNAGPLYSSERPLRIGLVIGTYSSVPYVHMGLESHRRHYPNVAVLVHDDCSPKQNDLRRLCQEYGAFFEVNSIKKGHTLGDLSSFLGGLLWAGRQRLDIIVKFSRRFIPLYDWTQELVQLAVTSQEATFSNICRNLNWGFRSEAVGMHVASWLPPVERIKRDLLDRQDVFVEGSIHELAKSIRPCNDCLKWRREHPFDDWRAGYCPWPIMGENRIIKVVGALWHHSCTPLDYCEASQTLGLSYGERDFIIPDSHVVEQ